MIVILENYDGGAANSFLCNRVVASKRMHLEARKTVPKLGKCYHCKLVKERAMLMVCGRCGIAQYCSRKCQMAHWPSHKCDCDIYGCAPEQQQKAMNKAYGDPHVFNNQ